MRSEQTSIIDVQSVGTVFGAQVIHDGVSFSLNPGSIVALIGGSGTGKSTLLKEIIGLLQPTSGSVFLFGKNVWDSSESEIDALRPRFGVLFQHGALFSALTVGENIALPLVERTKLSAKNVASIVQLRLALVGLEDEVAQKLPSELSGGMIKRVSLARALVLEPELLFLDEPTSGLDPINARIFDQLIKTLSVSLGLTVFMVTHDLDSILGIADRVIALEHGKVIADGTAQEVLRTKNEWIHNYFSSRVVR